MTIISACAVGSRSATVRLPARAITLPPRTRTQPTGTSARSPAPRASCSAISIKAFIAAGRVAVNGAVIASPALDVTAEDRIAIDGKPLPARERTRFFLYHKSRGLMTTHADPRGRPTIFANLPRDLPRLISVGRLDFNT